MSLIITRKVFLQLALVWVFVQYTFVLSCQTDKWSIAGNEFVNSSPLKQSQVGFQVVDLKNGKIMADYRSNKLFTPASTIKVLYTLSVLDQMGPDFKYLTSIKTNGKVLPDGSLEGDLMIEASGDPSLASGRFNDNQDLDHFLTAILKLLQKNGINCIDGKLIIELQDKSHPVGGSWPWEDIGNYYGSGAWGFNFNENEYAIKFKVPDKLGKPATLLNTEPFIPYLRLKNEVITGKRGTGDQAYVFGGPENYHKVIRGTLASGSDQYSIKGAIPNPPYSFLMILQQFLESRGINSEGISINSIGKQNSKSLGTYRSPELIELCKACNDHSINLYSEAFGKLLLQSKGKLPGSGYPDKEDWKVIFEPYALPGNWVLTDACGLSSTNLVSPQTMNQFTIKLVDRLGLETVLDVLPENGKDGAAINFIKEKSFQNTLWLKSGSISGVLNYTGIFRSSKEDRYYSFTIFTNHNPGDPALVKKEIQKLLKSWINN